MSSPVSYRSVLLLAILLGPSTRSEELLAQEGFKPIFDGKTLEGWSAPDMRYWSVEDGAITGRSSDELPCTRNQFLSWQQGELDDFELKLEYRILGSAQANSGIQIRSQIAEDGHAVGYQADLDRFGSWLGALYDEHTGRQLLAQRGQRTVIDAAGERETSELDVGSLEVEVDGWNEYHIVAHGPRITLKVNGVTTADVTDLEKGHGDLSGRLAVQIHSGPPMTIQFRNIRLRRLDLAGDRRKLVLLAGRPSHPSGQHEFNAGIGLLARRLREIQSVAVAEYHDNGWPKDPTAFDNANAIVVYADGQGSHPLVEHMDEVDSLMRRGVGLMCMHYAVHVAPGREGNDFKRWIGGFYESGYSSNPHWDAALKVAPDHPVTRGVAPAVIHDEWYFCIRFRDGMKGVKTLLEARPSDATRSMNGWPRKPYQHIIEASGRSETLMWAVERDDGGRGVGFTGGHWHRNWAYDTQRKVVLNAMLWVAGASVPEGGVHSAPVTGAELNRGLDPKKPMVHVELPPALRP